MTRKFAVSTQTNMWLDNVYGEARADEALAWFKQFGFDALDLNLDSGWSSEMAAEGKIGPRYQKGVAEAMEEFRPLKEALAKYDMFVGQAHSTFPLYREGMDEINAALLHAVEIDCAICQYLGCPALVVHPLNHMDKAKERELNLNMYRKMMPFARKYGVKLCLENGFMNVAGHSCVGACTEASDACWYIDTLNAEAGEELFGFCFDIGHANASARNIRHELNVLGKRLTVLHLHDNDGARDLHQIPYTQQNPGPDRNSTDWEALLAGLKDIGYEGTINFETANALRGIPRELHPAALRLISAIGSYFRSRLMAE